MARVRVYKKDIKSRIMEELKCDYGFIINLTKEGRIQELQDAYQDESISDPKDIMEEIYTEYKDYCSVWKLDYEADNRNSKDYLARK